MDIFNFITLTRELGLDGVQINVIPDFGLHPEWGTLDGNDPRYLERVRTAIDEYDFYCEIDARGTTVSELAPVLQVAESLGATVVRSYIRYPHNVFDSAYMAAQVSEVAKVVPLLKDHGIRLAFENHEFETSTDMVEFVQAIDEPEWVGLLCDIGNSMMVWEEPLSAVKSMAPYSFGVHFKDHTVVRDPGPAGDEAQPLVCGVPLGAGSIELEKIYQVLMQSSRANSINLETCFPYCASFKRTVGTANSAAFHGTFRIAEPPFPLDIIRPTQYYYPHAVGLEALEGLIDRQLSELKVSTTVLKNLRENYQPQQAL